MEERIIDDEYGRGVRLRKTKDGYVDVTDELAEEPQTDGETAENQEEEIEFEFPVFATDEDDEELATLTPEQAKELLKRREEEALAKKAEYEKTCADGEELLETGSYHAAELKFEKALMLDDIATRATVGYWRAKTADFTQPDVLADEYVEDGLGALEHDLGTEALQIIKKNYQSAFEKRVAELEDEETPLTKIVEEKQEKRRVILLERLKKSSLTACLFAIPALVFLVLTIVFGVKNFSTKGDEYIVWTIVFAGLFLVSLLLEAFKANKAINDNRMYRANKRLRSTEEGKHLWSLRAYKKFYTALLPVEKQQADEE
jgi:hypothetical protein